MPHVPKCPYREDQRPLSEAIEKAGIAAPWPDWLGLAVELVYFGPHGDNLRRSHPADRGEDRVLHRALRVFRVMMDPEVRAAAGAARALDGCKAGAVVVDTAIEDDRARVAAWCRAQGLP